MQGTTICKNEKKLTTILFGGTMGKRYNNIYDEIFTYENISLALENAYKNKNSKRKKEKLKYIIDNKEFYINQILKNRKISGEYRKAMTKDSSSGKIRKLYIPKFFPDQIIHHAIMQKTTKCFMRGMYKWSCSSIKGRGPLYASNGLMKVLKNDPKHTKWFIHIDICKYYDSIDLNILKKQLRKLFKDKKLLKLLDEIIDTGATDTLNHKGLPIGNYTSQWLANFYLQTFDHYVKEDIGVPHYFRYADDLVILNGNKKELKRDFFTIKDYLFNDLSLNIHNTTLQKLQHNNKGVGINFVGYMHFNDKRKIRKRIWVRVRKIFLKIENMYRKFRYKTKLLPKVAHAIMSYYGYIKHSNSYFINQYYLFNENYIIRREKDEMSLTIFNWCRLICREFSLGISV